VLTIGKVAKRTALSPSAIRYYERLHLITPSRLPNGYRAYCEDAVRSLLFLSKAQTLGFSLEEIKRLLEIARGGNLPCISVRELARQRIGEIDRRIMELRVLRARLRALLSQTTEPDTGELCPLVTHEPRATRKRMKTVSPRASFHP
jgi:MerR family copper efflux transcriptional regulator